MGMNDRDEIQETKPKWWKINLSSFAAAVVALRSLLINLLRILLVGKYIQDKNYAILFALLLKRSYFVYSATTPPKAT